jgi:hypothetical protein
VALANFASARSAKGCYPYGESVRVLISPFVPSEHGQPVARATCGIFTPGWIVIFDVNARIYFRSFNNPLDVSINLEYEHLNLS